MIQLFSAEIERVKGDYRVNIMRENIDRWPLICKPHKNCNGGFEEPIGFNAQNVLDHLAPDKRWDERARASCLLRNIKAGKEIGVYRKDIDEEFTAKHRLAQIDMLMFGNYFSFEKISPSAFPIFFRRC